MRGTTARDRCLGVSTFQEGFPPLFRHGDGSKCRAPTDARTSPHFLIILPFETGGTSTETADRPSMTWNHLTLVEDQGGLGSRVRPCRRPCRHYPKHRPSGQGTRVQTKVSRGRVLPHPQMDGRHPLPRDIRTQNEPRPGPLGSGAVGSRSTRVHTPLVSGDIIRQADDPLP